MDGTFIIPPARQVPLREREVDAVHEQRLRLVQKEPAQGHHTGDDPHPDAGPGGRAPPIVDVGVS